MDRREQILTTATDMFSEVGYRGTSLRDIAMRVGITHPGLLYHFHSKEELLQAVLAKRDAESRAAFGLDDVVSSPLDAVRGIIANMAANTAVPGMIELFSTLSAESTDSTHPAHAYFAERYQMLIREIVKVVDALREDGKLRNPELDGEQFGQEFVALMEGLQVQWLYAPEQTHLVEILVNRVNSELTADAQLDPNADWEHMFHDGEVTVVEERKSA